MASRTTVAVALTGAEIRPEVRAKGRYASQYAAAIRAKSKTAMLKLMYFRTLPKCTWKTLLYRDWTFRRCFADA